MAMFNVVAGSHFYVGGALPNQAADFVAGDFSAQSWVEVDGWQQMGDFGDEANVITTAFINRSRDVAQVGTDQVVMMENRFAVIDTDPGQIALYAAKAAKVDYAFRIVFPSGAERLFVGIVPTVKETGGDANTLTFLQVVVGRNSNAVRVPA